MTDQDLQHTLNQIVGMIDTLGKKVDNIQVSVDAMKQDIDTMKQDIDVMKQDIIDIKKDVASMKAEQNEMNDRLDTIASMYGSHEEAIRKLKARKIL